MSDYVTPEAPTPGLRNASTPRTLLAGFALGAVVVGAAWGITSGSGGRSTFTLTGTMTITGGSINTLGVAGNGNPCKGSNQDADINAGTSVTVYDASGNIVGEGALGAGVESGSAGNCVFPVTVPGVTAGANFYQVEVSNRGKLAVTEAQAKAGEFAASLN